MSMFRILSLISFLSIASLFTYGVVTCHNDIVHHTGQCAANATPTVCYGAAAFGGGH